MLQLLQLHSHIEDELSAIRAIDDKQNTLLDQLKGFLEQEASIHLVEKRRAAEAQAEKVRLEVELEAVYDRYAQLCSTNDFPRRAFSAVKAMVATLGGLKVPELGRRPSPRSPRGPRAIRRSLESGSEIPDCPG